MFAWSSRTWGVDVGVARTEIHATQLGIEVDGDDVRVGPDVELTGNGVGLTIRGHRALAEQTTFAGNAVDGAVVDQGRGSQLIANVFHETAGVAVYIGRAARDVSIWHNTVVTAGDGVALHDDRLDGDFNGAAPDRGAFEAVP